MYTFFKKTAIALILFALQIQLYAQDFDALLNNPINNLLSIVLNIIVKVGYVMIVFLGVVGVYKIKTDKQGFPTFLGWSVVAIGFWVMCIFISKNGIL